MSNSIKKYLLSLEEHEETNVVSESPDEAENPIDPAESDVMADEPIDMNEDSQEEDLEEPEDEKDEKLIGEERNLDSVMDATAALEAYIGLLENSGSDGISQETAAFMNVGLKVVGRHLPNVDLGLEEFEYGPLSNVTAVKISVEDLKDKLKTAKEYIIKLFNDLMAMVVAKVKNIGSGLYRVEGNLKKVKDTLDKKNKENKGLKENWDGILVRNGSAFEFIGDEPVENLSETISGLTFLMTTLTPYYIKESLQDLEKFIGTVDVERLSTDDIDERFKKLSELITKKGESITDFKGEVLPGNYELTQSGKYKILKITKDENGSAPDNLEYDIENLDLSKVIKELLKDVDRVKAIHTATEEIEGIISNISRSADKMLSKKYDDEESGKLAQSLVNEAVRMSKQLSMDVYDNMVYLVKLMAVQTIICKEYMEAMYN